MAGIAAAATWIWIPADRAKSTPSGEIRSVVVLPFLNFSPDPGNEYFSDGLTEELINALTAAGGLHVVARTTRVSVQRKTPGYSRHRQPTGR
jgi:TolB-like protein